MRVRPWSPSPGTAGPAASRSGTGGPAATRRAVAGVLVAALLVAVLLALTAPPVAGSSPTGPAGPGGDTAVHAVGQDGPDAPADDGTGGSDDGTGGSDDADGSRGSGSSGTPGDDDEIGEPVPVEGIIPRPNSGREPTEAGDRGGALQVLVLVAIVAGVGGATVMVVRESRRNRARQP